MEAHLNHRVSPAGAGHPQALARRANAHTESGPAAAPQHGRGGAVPAAAAHPGLTATVNRQPSLSVVSEEDTPRSARLSTRGFSRATTVGADDDWRSKSGTIRVSAPSRSSPAVRSRRSAGTRGRRDTNLAAQAGSGGDHSGKPLSESKRHSQSVPTLPLADTAAPRHHGRARRRRPRGRREGGGGGGHASSRSGGGSSVSTAASSARSPSPIRVSRDTKGVEYDWSNNELRERQQGLMMQIARSILNGEEVHRAVWSDVDILNKAAVSRKSWKSAPSPGPGHYEAKAGIGMESGIGRFRTAPSASIGSATMAREIFRSPANPHTGTVRIKTLPSAVSGKPYVRTSDAEIARDRAERALASVGKSKSSAGLRSPAAAGAGSHGAAAREASPLTMASTGPGALTHLHTELDAAAPVRLGVTAAARNRAEVVAWKAYNAAGEGQTSEATTPMASTFGSQANSGFRSAPAHIVAGKLPLRLPGIGPGEAVEGGAATGQGPLPPASTGVQIEGNRPNAPAFSFSQALRGPRPDGPLFEELRNAPSQHSYHPRFLETQKPTPPSWTLKGRLDQADFNPFMNYRAAVGSYEVPGFGGPQPERATRPAYSFGRDHEITSVTDMRMTAFRNAQQRSQPLGVRHVMTRTYGTRGMAADWPSDLS